MADQLRCEETMAGCWRVLDPFYSRPTQFAQDLMSEITATKRIQYSEYERLFEYYTLLHGNITEAKKANLMEALLTQANIALMEQLLPAWEIEVWRGHQAGYAPALPCGCVRGICRRPGGMGFEEYCLLHSSQQS